MRTRKRAWAVAAAIALLAGCTTNPMPNMVTSVAVPDSTSTTASAPTTSTSTTANQSPSSSSNSPTTTTPKPSTSTESDRSWADEPISDKEAADRKAAEQAWITYENVSKDLWEKPQSTWESALSKYAVDPALTKGLEGLKQFVADGKGSYGAPGHDVYWQTPIDGGAVANMGDCVDAHDSGSMNAKTGKKLTGGVEHQNTLVVLVRQQDDSWKVAEVHYMPNLACPGTDLSANEEKASMEAATSEKTS